MEDISIFQDRATLPKEGDLMEKLGSSYILWNAIQEFVMERYPGGKAEWNYPGKKYGWSFRIKDKKRAILYFLPRDNYFKVAFVFGQKATDMVLNSNISTGIKTKLEQATKYAEGRGIQIEVRTKAIFPEIQQLIEIKLSN